MLGIIWLFHVLVLVESSPWPNNKAPLDSEIVFNARVGLGTAVVELDLSRLLGAGVGSDEDRRGGVEVIDVQAVLLKDMASFVVYSYSNLD